VPLDATTLDTLARSCYGNPRAIRLVRDVLDRLETMTGSGPVGMLGPGTGGVKRGYVVRLDTLLTNKAFLISIASFLMPNELFGVLTRVCKKFSWVIRDHLSFSKVYVQMYRRGGKSGALRSGMSLIGSTGGSTAPGQASGNKRTRDQNPLIGMTGPFGGTGFGAPATNTAGTKKRRKSPDEEFWTDDETDPHQRAYDVSDI
jgi:hypothetical protein